MEPGDRIYYANSHIVRRPPWQEDNRPVDVDDLISVAGDIAVVQLQSKDGAYERVNNDGSFVMFIPAAEVGSQMPVITRGLLAPDAATALFGDLRGRQQIDATIVIIDALCQLDLCSYR